MFKTKIYPDKMLEYLELVQHLESKVSDINGYLGRDSVRNQDGVGISISFWENIEAITKWKNHPDHLGAKEKGRMKIFEKFEFKVWKVEDSKSLLESMK